MLKLAENSIDQSATVSLRGLKRIPAKNNGSLSSAVKSAAYYAKKYGHTMFVYVGNSYGHTVHRVSERPSEYLDPINNTGERVVSVSPDLEVRWHSLTS